MEAWKKITFYIACVLFLLSLAFHVTSIFECDIMEQFPMIFLLHFLVIGLWIPAILYLKSIGSTIPDKPKPGVFLKMLLAQRPRWIIIVAVLFFIYAAVNFSLMAARLQNSPAIQDHQYVLQNHGKFVRTITEAEYHTYRSYEVRLFSGHWMAFCAIAATILFPFYRMEWASLYQNKKSALK